MKKENKILLWGCCVSLLIIIVLFIIRANKEDWLDIKNIQWIGVAVLPMVLALIVGKFIKKFSGFGVELEIVSEKPLSTSTSIIETLHTVYATDKSSMDVLWSMSDGEQSQTDVLRFQTGKKNYYNADIVLEYLKQLPNVKFFEIVENSGKFKSLTRINRLTMIKHSQINRIQTFINSVENVTSDESINTTRYSISQKTSAIDTIKEIRQSGKPFIAVLDTKKKLIGLVFKSKLEEFLATVLINAAEKND